MSDKDDFFDMKQLGEAVIDLGKCVHCGNHELFYAPEGTPYWWSRRDCCLPNALRRASAMAFTLQDGPDKCSDYQLVLQDLKALTGEVQSLLAKHSDKRAALETAKKQMLGQDHGIDIVGRILRNLEGKR